MGIALPPRANVGELRRPRLMATAVMMRAAKAGDRKDKNHTFVGAQAAGGATMRRRSDTVLRPI